MAKKTARGAKPGQQRSKEEQWRKRMAAQARAASGVGAVAPAARPVVSAASDEAEDTGDSSAKAQTMTRQRAAPAASSVARTSSAATSAAVQRRSAAASRGARTRLGANTLSIEDEMRYIKGDIRGLIILTAVCLAVIIVLSFVVPSIIK